MASVERQLVNGSGKLIARESYNYFVDNAGRGASPYTFRVADSYGNSLVDSDIVLAAGAETVGEEQFPAMS